MNIEVNLVSLRDHPIYIPWATKFQNINKETDLWLYETPRSINKTIPGFVICPYPREVWADLWSVNIMSRDQPGVMSRLAKFFQIRNINIISINSSTLNRGRYHASNVIIDCSQYKSSIDHDISYRSRRVDATLNQLKRELILTFIEELRFFNPLYPNISIERILTLWRLFDDYRGTVIGNGMKLSIDKNSNVVIPIKNLDKIYNIFSANYSKTKYEIGEIYGIVTTEESANTIFIYPFFKNIGIVSFVVSLENKPGAIATLCSIISDNNFNIITSNAWTAENQERTFLWVLIQELDGKNRTDKNLMLTIQNYIGKSTLLEEFKPIFPLVY